MVRPGDICYFWPGASTEAMEEAHKRGGIIVVEFVNSHVAYAKRILDAECNRLGVPHQAHLSEAEIVYDNRRLELSDFVFSPGPFTSTSIREFGKNVPTLLETSYGAYPAPDRTRSHDGPLRFLFVGTAGIRKGVPVLLDAWRRAALPAELWFVGVPEPNLKLFDTTADNVKWLPYTREISEVYNSSDIFVFPSHEEGDPQVTCEAAAHGLPLIVTPMGGGRVAVDRRNAIVVPPGDASALAAAMTELFHSSQLRSELGANARADAANYTWDRVARGRLAMLATAISTRGKLEPFQIS